MRLLSSFGLSTRANPSPSTSKTAVAVVYRISNRTCSTTAPTISNEKKASSSSSSSRQIKIIYEDNHLLVISKPSNVPCESGSLFKTKKGSFQTCIQTLSEEYLQNKYNKPGKAYVALVHRLDRWTTGVMVLAKTSKAAQRLSLQFREKTISKTYICVVSGHVENGGECRHWLSNTRERKAIVRGQLDYSQAILDTRVQVREHMILASTHTTSDININNRHISTSTPESSADNYYEANLSYRPLGSWVWPKGETLEKHKERAEGVNNDDSTATRSQMMSLLEVTPTTGSFVIIIMMMMFIYI